MFQHQEKVCLTGEEKNMMACLSSRVKQHPLITFSVLAYAPI
jgi:hypothetical protein